MGKKIAIVTSGGDAPGMNAAIRGVFRSTKRRDPDHEIILFNNGFRGLAGRLEASMDVDVQRRELRDILNRGGTCIGTGRVPELLPADPDAPDAEERREARESFLDVAAVNLYQLEVSGLVVIGGDGSYRGAHAIAEAYRAKFGRSLKVVGIPATIDNDIYGTDYTIGYDTAVGNTVDALRKIRDTVESHRRAVILEVMGNASGWLALSAGIAAGASTILIPEIAETYDPRAVVGRCVAALEGDYRYFIIVMAEGVKKASGDERYGEHLAKYIAQSERIHEVLGHPMSVRNNVIGHLARGGPPSAFDNILAARFARGAVKVVVDDVAMSLRGRQVVPMPLGEVVGHGPRLVSRDDELFAISQDLTVSQDQPF
jgi:6-phosphofructokinase 1